MRSMQELIDKIEELENRLQSEQQSGVNSVSQYTPGISKGLPEMIRIGTLTSNGQELPFYLPGSSITALAIEKTDDNAFDVSLAIQSIVLQLVLSIPRELLKFYLIDVMNFGSDFGSLSDIENLELSIIDDELEIQKILNEEKLNARNLIQKTLGARYKTLEEYNLESDNVEPYRFMIISGFPQGISNKYIMDLHKLIVNGRKLGFHTILTYDRSEELDDYSRKLLDQCVNLSINDSGIYTIKNHPDSEFFNAFELQVNSAWDGVDIDFKINELNDDYAYGVDEDEHTDGISIPIGSVGNELFHLELGYNTTTKSTPHHGMIAGSTGSGKSNLINAIIGNGIKTYKPDELGFVLLDCKGVEFQEFKKANSPQILKLTSAREDLDIWTESLQFINNLFLERAELFNEAGVGDIIKYKLKTGKSLPRIVWIIDEFQNLLTIAGSRVHLRNDLPKKVFNEGRAFGIHLIVVTQNLGGDSVGTSIKKDLPLRIALKLTADQSGMFLDYNNTVASTLKVGEAIYNPDFGDKGANVKIKVDDMRSKLDEILEND